MKVSFEVVVIYLFTFMNVDMACWSLMVFKDVNPVCRLRDEEEGTSGDVVSDPPDSFLLCVSESWDKPKKQLTIGLVVSLSYGWLEKIDSLLTTRTESTLHSIPNFIRSEVILFELNVKRSKTCFLCFACTCMCLFL